MGVLLIFAVFFSLVCHVASQECSTAKLADSDVLDTVQIYSNEYALEDDHVAFEISSSAPSNSFDQVSDPVRFLTSNQSACPSTCTINLNRYTDTFQGNSSTVLFFDIEYSYYLPSHYVKDNKTSLVCVMNNGSCGATVPVIRYYKITNNGVYHAYSFDPDIVYDGYNQEFMPICYAWTVPTGNVASRPACGTLNFDTPLSALADLRIYDNAVDGIERDHYYTTVPTTDASLVGYNQTGVLGKVLTSPKSTACSCLVKLQQQFDNQTGYFHRLDHKLVVTGMEPNRPYEEYHDTGETVYCAKRLGDCGATLPLWKHFQFYDIDTVYTTDSSPLPMSYLYPQTPLCYIWPTNYSPNISNIPAAPPTPAPVIVSSTTGSSAGITGGTSGSTVMGSTGTTPPGTSGTVASTISGATFSAMNSTGTTPSGSSGTLASTVSGATMSTSGTVASTTPGTLGTPGTSGSTPSTTGTTASTLGISGGTLGTNPTGSTSATTGATSGTSGTSGTGGTIGTTSSTISVWGTTSTIRPLADATAGATPSTVSVWGTPGTTPSTISVWGTSGATTGTTVSVWGTPGTTPSTISVWGTTPTATPSTVSIWGTTGTTVSSLSGGTLGTIGTPGTTTPHHLSDSGTPALIPVNPMPTKSVNLETVAMEVTESNDPTESPMDGDVDPSETFTLSDFWYASTQAGPTVTAAPPALTTLSVVAVTAGTTVGAPGASSGSSGTPGTPGTPGTSSGTPGSSGSSGPSSGSSGTPGTPETTMVTAPPMITVTGSLFGSLNIPTMPPTTVGTTATGSGSETTVTSAGSTVPSTTVTSVGSTVTSAVPSALGSTVTPSVPSATVISGSTVTPSVPSATVISGSTVTPSVPEATTTVTPMVQHNVNSIVGGPLSQFTNPPIIQALISSGSSTPLPISSASSEPEPVKRVAENTPPPSSTTEAPGIIWKAGDWISSTWHSVFGGSGAPSNSTALNSTTVESSTPKPIGGLVGSLISEGINSTVQSDNFNPHSAGFLNNTKNWLDDKVNSTGEFLSNAWSSLGNNDSWVNGAMNSTGNFLSNAWQSNSTLVNGTKTWVNGAMNSTGEFLSNAWNTVGSNETKTWVNGAVNSTGEFLSNAWDETKEHSGSFMNTSKTWISEQLNGTNLIQGAKDLIGLKPNDSPVLNSSSEPAKSEWNGGVVSGPLTG